VEEAALQPVVVGGRERGEPDIAALKSIHEHSHRVAKRIRRRRRLKRSLLTPAMSAAGSNPLPGDTAALRSMSGLRRCVICTGLSVFKRSRRSAPNEQLNSAKDFGGLGSPASAFAPPDGSFTCYGQERLAYVHAPPADDARLDQPDVSFMWCMGKSVFLLQSGLPGSAHAPEKAGRSWTVSSSHEVPISYRGISQSMSVDEFADSSERPASSKSRSAATSAGSSANASQHSDQSSRESPLFPTVADLKPYFKESCSMLYEALFTAQAHKHAAAVLSSSVLSGSAHLDAFRALEAGHAKACSILHKTFYKWFGTGGS
jgi:hypothetical protein